MNIFSRIIRSDPHRKTRLHDEKGNSIPLGRLLRNGSRAHFTGIVRLIFGRRPKQPWISYDAINVLQKHLTKESNVLEFGSGMSTVWYAKHAAYVCSVENYLLWYEKVRAILQNENATNVDYLFANGEHEYVQVGTDGILYDLIMVDGSYRSACVAGSIPLLAPRGILYLDNSDKDMQGGDVREAERLCLDFAKRKGLKYEFYTDFAPAQLVPNEGLLIWNS